MQHPRAEAMKILNSKQKIEDNIPFFFFIINVLIAALLLLLLTMLLQHYYNS